MAASLGLVASTVDAAVPGPKDFESCNAAAREAVRKGGDAPSAASPSTKDEHRAAEAKRGNLPDDRAGAVRDHPDPQLEGMDAEGAKDPRYQAAYRTCMRQSGF